MLWDHRCGPGVSCDVLVWASIFEFIVLCGTVRASQQQDQYQVKVAVSAAWSSRNCCHFVKLLKLRMLTQSRSWCGQILATWLEVAITLPYCMCVPPTLGLIIVICHSWLICILCIFTMSSHSLWPQFKSIRCEICLRQLWHSFSVTAGIPLSCNDSGQVVHTCAYHHAVYFAARSVMLGLMGKNGSLCLGLWLSPASWLFRQWD